VRRRNIIGALLAVSALAAGAVGVAQGSSSKQVSSTRRTTQSSSGRQMAGAPPGGVGPGAGSVHAVSVVLDKAGTAFIEQTSDRGTIQSVDSSADTITVLEGTKAVTYKTVTLNVPANATVMLDGNTSSLSGLAEGDEVSVSSSSDGTAVLATDSSFHPMGGPGRGAQPPAGQAPSAAG
jgi:hypothetical protein